ncbi:MAG: PAS domain-containing protein [Anaerolineae bacterium]|nr:PAS domain-containing protein [Anaerolineae bacterium]
MIDAELFDRLLAFSQHMAQLHEVDTLLRDVLNAAVQLSGAEEGFLALVNGDQVMNLVAQRAAQTVDPQPLSAALQALVHEVATQRTPLEAPPWFLVPLLSPQEVLGVLGLQGVPHPQQARRVLAYLANQAAVFLENRILTTQLESQVSARTAELLASEARYRALLKTSPDGILVTDIHEQIVLASQTAARLFGFARQRT